MYQKEKFYTIKAGIVEPKEVERGEINKTTGLPQGTTEKGQSVLGRFGIPNYSKVWAKPEIGPDGKLTGHLEFVPWGTEGGEVREIRYLKNSKSLDKQYQDKAGLKPGQEDGQIFLNYGINTIDGSIEPLLVQMLKVHTYNGDSICRDPSNIKVVFREYDEKKMINRSLQGHELKLECMNLIMTIKDNSKKLMVYAYVFQMDAKRPDQLILAELMEFADKNPGLFIEQKNFYQNKVQQIVGRASEFGVLELGINGEVHLTGERNGPLLDKLPPKMLPNKKLDYINENCFEPEVFDAINRIADAVLKKEQLLN